MGARVRKDPALVWANVGVHAGVAIELAIDRRDGEGAAIYIGHTGPDLILEFADPESMELLSAVAAEGARLMREREKNQAAAAREQSGEVDRLVGAGVS